MTQTSTITATGTGSDMASATTKLTPTSTNSRLTSETPTKTPTFTDNKTEKDSSSDAIKWSLIGSLSAVGVSGIGIAAYCYFAKSRKSNKISTLRTESPQELSGIKIEMMPL